MVVTPRLLALLIAIWLVGCSDEPWQTKEVDGLLPPLQLQLSGTTGAPLTESALRGRTVLLAFGFMSCPDICPSTLAKLAALKRSLPAEVAERIQIVFVSVDPARDHPQQLAAFAGHFGAGVLGVTGTEPELRTLSRRYRTTYSYGEPDTAGSYDVAHSTGVYVFDADGRARLLFRPGDSIDAMREDLLRLVE